MTPLNTDGSVVIAGLGLRLGSQPAEPLTTIIPPSVNPNLVRVFVTELVPGGAAERSQLLRLNDEILHVDHVSTAGRSVVRSWPISFCDRIHVGSNTLNPNLRPWPAWCF
jgi:C-terminal processing protease CtpA/Prc